MNGVIKNIRKAYQNGWDFNVSYSDVRELEFLEYQNDSLAKENERLRKALEFYADGQHYEPYCIGEMGASDVTEDAGYIAREALNNGEALHGNSRR